MHTISENDIDFITNDLCNRGVTDELLRDQLVDHICCMLEQEGTAGDDYNLLVSYQQLINTLDHKIFPGLQHDMFLANNIRLQNLTRILFMILGTSLLLLIAWLMAKDNLPVLSDFWFSASMLLLLTACLPFTWYIFHLRYAGTRHQVWIGSGGVFLTILLLAILGDYWGMPDGSAFVFAIFICFLTISVPLFLFGFVRSRISTVGLLYRFLFMLTEGIIGYWMYQDLQIRATDRGLHYLVDFLR